MFIRICLRLCGGVLIVLGYTFWN